MIPRRAFLILLLTVPVTWPAQPACSTTHLTIFDANVAEFFDERTFDLQSGPNIVEWRSLLPQAYIRTVRISGPDRVTVVRQDITYDGPEVRSQKSPVLHLVVQNAGTPGPRKLYLDYLAPGLSWKGDYSLSLGLPGADGTPGEMQLDGWVTVQNDTNADICAGSVDLIAGQVQLLLPGSNVPRTFTANAQVSSQSSNFGAAVASPGDGLAEVKAVSVFSRFSLGRDISLTANASVGRFPLFQRLMLPVQERHIFENEANEQTLGRGGFMLAPRSLEVRLVSRNQSKLPFPAGIVTIYSLDEDVPQVVGQDQILLTPDSADFSVTQGQSGTLQGTRRVLSRTTVPISPGRNKLVTQVEVVIENRGAKPTSAYVREAVEGYGTSWTVTESTHDPRKLGDRMMDFRLPLPAHDRAKLTYTVESQ